MPASTPFSTFSRWLLPFIGIVCTTASSQSLPAANFLPRALPDVSGITISKRVDEVNLAFTVTDKKGHLINDLGFADFSILDNHLAPEGVNFFQQQTDLPLRVAVLVDASDSILYRFDYEKSAAGSFLKHILRPGKDQAFVVAFNDHVRLIHDDTDNTRALSKAVKRIQAGGNTALYDAVMWTAGKLQGSPPQTRRAIILISDGEDTHSKARLFEAEQAAVRAQVTLFALSTNEFPFSHSAGEEVMKLLTAGTGGMILPARDEYHLSRAFRQVEQALRNQYAIAYRPARFTPDGSFRLVEILTARKGLRIQCRRGYYAREQASILPEH
ncbi:MAG TPA: VWA domain-containing protein [Terriglobales bacterium]|nr:VWA domain-containing protein [Terriglobales bacterium]